MNRYLSWIIVLLLLTVILFGIDMFSQYKDIEAKLQTERFLREQKELELEKEIRLLKQDVYNLQYGYEGVENVRKN